MEQLLLREEEHCSLVRRLGELPLVLDCGLQRDCPLAVPFRNMQAVREGAEPRWSCPEFSFCAAVSDRASICACQACNTEENGRASCCPGPTPRRQPRRRSDCLHRPLQQRVTMSQSTCLIAPETATSPPLQRRRCRCHNRSFAPCLSFVVPA